MGDINQKMQVIIRIVFLQLVLISRQKLVTVNSKGIERIQSSHLERVDDGLSPGQSFLECWSAHLGDQSSFVQRSARIIRVPLMVLCTQLCLDWREDVNI